MINSHFLIVQKLIYKWEELIMKHKNFKSNIGTLLVATVIMSVIMPLLIRAFTPKASARITTGYGVKGYHLSQKNTQSGRIIIGDQRVCQLWNDNPEGASFVAVWDGDYSARNGRGINSSKGVSIIRRYVEETLDEKGYCDVYIFPSIDGDNIQKIAKLANELNATPGVKVFVMGAINKDKDMSPVNDSLKSGIRSGVVFKEMKNMKGENGGYSSDDQGFNKVTIKRLWKQINKH